MLGRWKNWGATALLLLAVLGCRKTMPPIKPDKEPEALVAPPMESRFNSPAYPKQAFADRDAGVMKNLDDVKQMRGPGAMGAGMGGMGGMPGGR